MEERRTYKVEDLIEEIAMGPFGSNIKVECFQSDGIPVLNGSNLFGYKLNEDSFNYVSEEKADSLGHSNAYRGDIVITHRGTLGQIVYIPRTSKYERYVISQSQFRLRLNTELVIPGFFVYFFHTREGQHRLLSNASQVGVPAIARPTSTFRKVCIELPSIEQQKKIVRILDSISDKIELNNRINHNLEEQAQALYKSWFVDFEPFKGGKFVESELGMIPEGWSIYALEDLMEIRRGSSPRPIQSFLSDSGLRWLKISDATNTASPFVFSIQEHIRQEGLKNTVLRKEGTLVLSNSATPGLPKFLGVDTCIHDGWLYFENSRLSNELMYLLFNHFRQELISQANGSVFMNLKTDILKKMKIAIPGQSTMNAFDNVVKSIFRSIKSRCQEINTLISERDSLLPRLMSGEITC